MISPARSVGENSDAAGVAAEPTQASPQSRCRAALGRLPRRAADGVPCRGSAALPGFPAVAAAFLGAVVAGLQVGPTSPCGRP